MDYSRVEHKSQLVYFSVNQPQQTCLIDQFWTTANYALAKQLQMCIIIQWHLVHIFLIQSQPAYFIVIQPKPFFSFNHNKYIILNQSQPVYTNLIQIQPVHTIIDMSEQCLLV